MAPRVPWTLAGLAGASLLMVHSVLGAFVAGVLWAVLAWPIHKAFRHRMRSTPAALLTLALTGTLAVMLGVLVARLILADLKDVGSIASLFDSAPAWLAAYEGKAAALAGSLAGRLQQAAGRALIQLPIALFVAFCCLREAGRLGILASRALPLPAAESVLLLERAATTTRAVARGQVLTAAIKGTVGGLGLWMAGVPGAALWGVVMALFTLLPVLTAWMVWIPAALWLSSIGHTGAAIFLSLWGMLVVGLIDNWVRPHIVGKQARIHPMVALLGIAGGAATLGLPGLVAGPVLLDTTLQMHRAWRTRHEPSPPDVSTVRMPRSQHTRPPPAPHALSPRSQDGHRGGTSGAVAVAAVVPWPKW